MSHALGLSLLCALLAAPVLETAPLDAATTTTVIPETDETHHFTNEEVAAYLERYNFMTSEQSNPDSPLAQIQAHDVTSGILAFQRKYNLTETGQMDEETRRWMEMPRCGNKDVMRPEDTTRRKKRYDLQGNRWGKSTLTYRISDYPDNDISRSDTDAEIEQAFKVWSDVTPLNFERRSSGSVDIEVLFGSGYHGDDEPFDGRGKVLAHAYFPNFGGDAHFDDDESWSIRSFRGTNLLQVAAHEFGHSLGLGHSEDRNALMAPFYRGYDPNFMLHSDDINGIRRLYGTNMDPPTQPPAPPRTTSSTTTTTTTTRRPDNPSQPTEAPRPPPTERPQTPPPTEAPPSGVPDFCSNAQFDAMTLHEVDGTTFTYVFQGDYYARLTTSGMANDYPRRIGDDWRGLPGNIDAALYWETLYEYNIVNGRWTITGVERVGRTYFFKGDLYWRYENMQVLDGYPKRIADGWPGLPNDLDAAFVWSGNDRTYFIKGNQYYRYTSMQGVDKNYPRSLSVWQGLPSSIDAAVQWQNSRTYFFVGTQYYRFDDRRFRVDSNNYPRENNYWWIGCTGSNIMDEETGYIGADSESNEEYTSGANLSKTPPTANIVLFLLSVIGLLNA